MADSSEYYHLFIKMTKEKVSSPREFGEVLKKANGYYPMLVEYVRGCIHDYFYYPWTRSDDTTLSIFAALLANENMFNDVIESFMSYGIAFGIDEIESADVFNFIPLIVKRNIDKVVETLFRQTAYKEMLNLHTVTVVHHE